MSREDLSTWGQGHKNYKLPVATDSYVICFIYLKSLEIEIEILFCEKGKATATWPLEGPVDSSW